MSERVRNISNMMIATREFNAANHADYADLPDGAQKFGIIDEVVANLENYLADRSSGAAGQAIEQKSVLVLAVKRKMKEYAEAARALNLSNPGFGRLFHIPDGDGAQEVIAAGWAFVEEATNHPTEFARFRLQAADAHALKKDLDDLQAAVAAKAGAGAKTAGATAGIDDEIVRGMDAERFLDALMKIVYRHNAAKLGEWKTARHIRRAGSSPAATKPAKTDEKPPPT